MTLCDVCGQPYRSRPTAWWSVVAYCRFLFQHLHGNDERDPRRKRLRDWLRTSRSARSA